MSCVPRTACGVGILADLSLLMAAASNGFSSKRKARLQSRRWTCATFVGTDVPHEKSTVRRSGRHRRPYRLFPHPRAGSGQPPPRSEEHTSELQSLMRISYAVFCLKKKTTYLQNPLTNPNYLYHTHLITKQP